VILQSNPNPVSAGGFLNIKKEANKDPLVIFLRKIKQDIYFYFDLIGFEPTWQQKQFVDALVAGDPNIAVRSGKGPGKTACTAACLPWWSLTRPLSRVVVTAPTMRQCKDVWLSDSEKWIRGGNKSLKSLFKFTNTGYGVLAHSQKMWGCLLITATNPEALQGLHNTNLLIHCEEASGIDRGLMQAIQDTLTGHKGNNVWTAIGNPNTRTCRFFDFFHSLAGNPWTALHWNAEETPLSEWFSGQRNIEIEEEFGKDSDVYRVAVLGEFPSLDPDSLINEEELTKCFGTAAYSRAFAHADKKRQIGIDLARFGGDECVNVFRNGRVMLSMEAKNHIDPNDMIDRAVVLQDQFKWGNKDCTYVVDASGMGESAVGRIGSTKRMGKKVHEFYSQNTAHESNKYANKITEAWCGFAKMVRSGDLYLGDKPDRKLVLQLTNRKYSVDKDGKIKIESKDDYKKRMADLEHGELGKSPDRADAVVMAFYEHASQSQRIAIG
jgi:phage terminase large subunit